MIEYGSAERKSNFPTDRIPVQVCADQRRKRKSSCNLDGDAKLHTNAKSCTEIQNELALI